MSDAATMDAYGVLTEPTTLKIQRVLPGPIERVWDYLTRSELRKQWFASGDMTLEVGAPFTLTWRNEELNEPRGKRPEGATKSIRAPTRSLRSIRRESWSSPSARRGMCRSSWRRAVKRFC